MPEGHTIHRAARRLRSVLAGQQLERVEARGRQLVETGAASQLMGDRVRDVEARGKHLLVHTESGWSLHSHLRMDGAWHLYRTGERWKKARSRAWIRLGAGEWDAINFDGPVLDLHRTSDLERLPALVRLGPDVLVEPFDDDAFLARIRQHQQRQIGDVLLDQGVIAGIGNIYKSETLFLARTDPWARVEQLSDDTLRPIRAIASRIMLAGVLDPRAITYAGPGPQGRWVYDRAGAPCRRCSARIRSRAQGADQRITYWCEGCQSLRA